MYFVMLRHPSEKIKALPLVDANDNIVWFKWAIAFIAIVLLLDGWAKAWAIVPMIMINYPTSRGDK